MGKKRPLNPVKFRRAKMKAAKSRDEGRLYLNGRASLSLIALVVANLVPVAGVIFYGWDHRLVIALFWIENLIIGLFNVVKMCGAMIVNKQKGLSGIVTPLFFILHYGLFCAAHGLFLWSTLGLGELPAEALIFGPNTGPLQIFDEGLKVFVGFVELYSPVIVLGIVSLILSRFVSFIENFILKGEIFELTPRDLMAKPYGKIIALHVGIIMGAVAIDRFGSSLWLLLAIVGFKIIVDAITHMKEHRTSELKVDEL